MDYKLPLSDEGTLDGRPIVYVRPIAASELPGDLRAEVDGVEGLYAVHNAAGERLALVRGRELAFTLARQNDLSPVNAH